MNPNERLGVDEQKVMEVVGSDWRIGRKFTMPEYAMRAACFPRDLRSLTETFKEADVSPRILDAVNEVNKKRVQDRLDKIVGKPVLLLERSYKPGLSEVKSSPALALVRLLQSMGYRIETHDQVRQNAPEHGARNDYSHASRVALQRPVQDCRQNTKVVLDYGKTVDKKSLLSHVPLWQGGRGWRS